MCPSRDLGQQHVARALQQVRDEGYGPDSGAAASACKWELREAAQELNGFGEAVSLDMGC